MATRVAVVMERDPDGGTYVHLAVDGQWVEIGDGMAQAGVTVALHEIDAGRGHDGGDWFDSYTADVVRDALANDGEKFARCLLDAYRNPPGRKYIDGFEEARDAFDAETPEFEHLREE